MALHYKELERKDEKWGIDITVFFTDDEDSTFEEIRIFTFIDEEQIDSEFLSRIEKAYINIQDDYSEVEINETDIINKLEEYFATNTTIDKETYNNIVSSAVIVKVDVKGEIKGNIDGESLR
jgi:isocitrate dehydrogenase kinase/phosphatase